MLEDSKKLEKSIHKIEQMERNNFMGNHEILSPTLQKYYSALKSLDEFGRYGDFFDDVSNLDKFFSEFRNVTFVIQKNLKTEENNKIYSELRDVFLTGDTLKWFINI